MPELTRQDYLRIMAESLVSDGTMKRWISGKKIQQASAMRISKALATLGLQPKEAA